MTFEMVRTGWPNMVAILALAIMPFVALATDAARQAPQSEIAALDPAAAAALVAVAAVMPEAIQD